MDLKGKIYIIEDTEVFITLSSVDSFFCDDTMLVRCFIYTNYLFGLYFYLIIKSEQDIIIYLTNSLGMYSYKANINIKQENYAKVLKMKLLSNPDNEDITFEYSVELLRYVLPEIIDYYLPRFKDSLENMKNDKMVVL